MVATALIGASLHDGHRLIEGWSVVMDQGVITGVVREEELPATIARRKLDGGILSAGFIDLQVNGGGGALFNENPDPDALHVIAAAHRRAGTTGFLPTVISDDIAVIDRAMRAVEQAIAQGVPGVLGIHIEGPMLAHGRRGIHDAAYFRGPDPELLALAASLACGRTLVTLAPEVAGADAIAQLAASGVIVSAGHTDASYEEAKAGIDAGLTGATHLFNAMSQLTARSPGTVGALLEDPDIWCGVIVDGVHVHPATLRIAMQCQPVDRFVLVSDSMSPAGAAMESFTLQGREIFVLGDRLVDRSGTLAGANLTMAQGVRNCVDLVGLPLSTALRIASASPAAAIRLSAMRGRIAKGLAADLVWLDADLRVGGTWIAGEEFPEGER